MKQIGMYIHENLLFMCSVQNVKHKYVQLTPTK